MSDIKDILMNNGGKLPEEMLLAYLEGTLPVEQQHEVEQWLSEEGMESDAIDGLKEITPGETKYTVSQLNHQLSKQLKGKKHTRKQIKDNPWSWVAIALILLLIALAYVILRLTIK